MGKVCLHVSLSLSKYRTLFGYKPTSLLQPTTERLILSSTCTFSHMTYLINHVTCLNNTCGWSYELSRSGCSKLAANYQLVQFVTKLCSCIYIYIYISFFFFFFFFDIFFFFFINTDLLLNLILSYQYSNFKFYFK